jgi:hypothetical protein
MILSLRISGDYAARVSGWGSTRKTGEVHAISDSDGVPAWAHRGALVYYDRIKADVLRTQGSIVPSLARESWRAAASRPEAAARPVLRLLHAVTEYGVGASTPMRPEPAHVMAG